MAQASVMHTQAHSQQRTHTEQRLERARYEVDLARRQYDAVDPANRLVARELERRWEGALEACSHIETEARAQLEALEEPLSAEEHAQLQHLAQDLPSLWHASSTSSQAKKRIVRCLIDNVVVSMSERDMLQAQVHWAGGEATTLEVPKGKLGVHRSSPTRRWWHWCGYWPRSSPTIKSHGFCIASGSRRARGWCSTPSA